MADIIGVRVTSALDTLNSFVICNEPGGQTNPAVAFDGSNYIVVWSDTRFTGIFEWTTVARVTTDGIVLDTSYCIGKHDNSEYFPCIASGDSTSLVVWHQKYFGLCGRLLDASAQPCDSVFRIDSTQTNTTKPAIAVGDSTFCVVWSDYNESGTNLDIFGQVLTQDGAFLDSTFTIANNAIDDCEPDIIFDGEHYMIVWSADSLGICGQLITSAGQLIGNQLYISDTVVHQRHDPAVCASDANYLVSWSEWHDDFDIYGNIDISLELPCDQPGCTATLLPTIMYGTSNLKGFLPYDLYDVMGRKVVTTHLTQGIYFIVKGSQTAAKVIVVR